MLNPAGPAIGAAPLIPPVRGGSNSRFVTSSVGIGGTLILGPLALGFEVGRSKTTDLSTGKDAYSAFGNVFVGVGLGLALGRVGPSFGGGASASAPDSGFSSSPTIVGMAGTGPLGLSLSESFDQFGNRTSRSASPGALGAGAAAGYNIGVNVPLPDERLETPDLRTATGSRYR